MSTYQSTLDRVGLLVAANVRALLDRATDASALAVFDEQVSRMGEAVSELQTAEGVERGRARTLTRHAEALRGELEKLDGEIDWLLARGERARAAARQSLYNAKAGLLEQHEAHLAQCQLEVARLADSRGRLVAQIEATQVQRLQLAGLVEQRKAAELRVRALRSIGGFAPGQRRADDLIERNQQALEVAQGKADALSESIEYRLTDLQETEEVQVQILARQARLLAAGKPGELPEPRLGRAPRAAEDAG